MVFGGDEQEQCTEKLRWFSCGSLISRNVASGWRVEERAQVPAGCICIRSVNQIEAGAEAVQADDAAT